MGIEKKNNKIKKKKKILAWDKMVKQSIARDFETYTRLSNI